MSATAEREVLRAMAKAHDDYRELHCLTGFARDALPDMLRAARAALAAPPVKEPREAEAVAWIDPEFLRDEPYGKSTSPVTTYERREWLPLYLASAPVKDRAALADLNVALGWLESALNCKQFLWDTDQHEYAANALIRARAALAAPSGTPDGLEAEIDAAAAAGRVTFAEGWEGAEAAPQAAPALTDEQIVRAIIGAGCGRQVRLVYADDDLTPEGRSIARAILLAAAPPAPQAAPAKVTHPCRDGQQCPDTLECEIAGRCIRCDATPPAPQAAEPDDLESVRRELGRAITWIDEAPQAAVPAARNQWRHVRTGKVYSVFTVNALLEWAPERGAHVVYTDGSNTWVRPAVEFKSGVILLKVAEPAGETKP